MRSIYRITAISFLLWLWAGCAAHHKPNSEDTAGPTTSGYRGASFVSFIKEVREPKDLGVKPKWSERIKKWLSARKKFVMTPGAVRVWRSHRLLVCDNVSKGLHIFDMKAHRYTFIPFREPMRSAAEAVFLPDGSFIVSDAGSGYLFRFGADLTRGGIVNRGEPLARPTGLCFHETNRLLYVAETARHRIVKMTADGHVTGYIGARGTDPGAFNFPVHLTMNAQGKLFVEDTLNFRIQRFENDICTGVFGKPGDGFGDFCRPKGIAVDSFDRLYVPDTCFDVIQVFSEVGAVLLVLGEPGEKPGEFHFPAGVCIDDDHRLYVSDMFNHRIQVFSLPGERHE